MKRNPAREVREKRQQKAKERAFKKRLRGYGFSSKPTKGKLGFSLIGEVRSITGPSLPDYDELGEAGD